MIRFVGKNGPVLVNPDNITQVFVTDFKAVRIDLCDGKYTLVQETLDDVEAMVEEYYAS